MTPNRWDEIEEMFAAVLDRSGSDREDFLENLRRTDEWLAEEVSRLIGNHERAAGFLDNEQLRMRMTPLSGTPVTGLLNHPVYLNAGEVADGPRGRYGRTDWIYPLDVRADYAFRLSERGRLRLIADLFNVANQTNVFSRIQASEVDGSPGQRNRDFLKPAGYQSPFSARLAVRFEF